MITHNRKNIDDSFVIFNLTEKSSKLKLSVGEVAIVDGFEITVLDHIGQILVEKIAHQGIAENAEPLKVGNKTFHVLAEVPPRVEFEINKTKFITLPKGAVAVQTSPDFDDSFLEENLVDEIKQTPRNNKFKMVLLSVGTLSSISIASAYFSNASGKTTESYTHEFPETQSASANIQENDDHDEATDGRAGHDKDDRPNAQPKKDSNSIQQPQKIVTNESEMESVLSAEQNQTMNSEIKTGKPAKRAKPRDNHKPLSKEALLSAESQELVKLKNNSKDKSILQFIERSLEIQSRDPKESAEDSISKFEQWLQLCSKLFNSKRCTDSTTGRMGKTILAEAISENVSLLNSKPESSAKAHQFLTTFEAFLTSEQKKQRVTMVGLYWLGQLPQTPVAATNDNRLSNSYICGRAF